MTLYHRAFLLSDAHVACRFSHILAQSVVGWICIIRISRSTFSAMAIARSVSYVRCLNALDSSFCLGGSIYAISRAYILRYYKDFGIYWTMGGCPCTFVTSSTVAILPVSIPCIVPGSTSGLVEEPGILLLHLSDPNPPSRFSSSVGWK